MPLISLQHTSNYNNDDSEVSEKSTSEIHFRCSFATLYFARTLRK